jgi:uncharacterized protein YutE (UPF0331/DUF86 family)
MPPDKLQPDREILRRKLHFVEAALEQLYTIQQRGEAAFTADRILQDAAVRNLQVGIEAILDAANHIIARQHLGLPQTYQEAIDRLLEVGILPIDRAASLRRMVRFRNRAVHLYDQIRVDEIWTILTHHLDDFEAVIASLVRRFF